MGSSRTEIVAVASFSSTIERGIVTNFPFGFDSDWAAPENAIKERVKIREINRQNLRPDKEFPNTTPILILFIPFQTVLEYSSN